jgi:hypothetical protein
VAVREPLSPSPRPRCLLLVGGVDAAALIDQGKHPNQARGVRIMGRLATQNVLTNPADRLSHELIERLRNGAHSLEVELRYERLRPARLPLDQVLNVDAHSDKAERPGLTSEAFTAPRSKATGYEDGCFTECA